MTRNSLTKTICFGKDKAHSLVDLLRQTYQPFLWVLLIMIPAISANASLLEDQTRQYNVLSEGYVNSLEEIESNLQTLDQETANAPDSFATTPRSGFNPYRTPAIFVDVGTSLFSDADRDGFFAGFSVSVDIDIINSSYHDIPVFVRVFLRPPEEPFQLFHVSDRFRIYRSLISDTYRIESELVTNFPAGYYDMQLELVDAITGETLDVIDDRSYRSLSGLPLESIDRTGVLTQLAPMGTDENSALQTSFNDTASDAGLVREAVVREHVGSMWFLLPVLLSAGLIRRFRR